jgi:hypothetical protein
MGKMFSACKNCNNTSKSDTVYECKNCKQRYCSSCLPSETCKKCGKKPGPLSFLSQFREIGQIR